MLETERKNRFKLDLFMHFQSYRHRKVTKSIQIPGRQDCSYPRSGETCDTMQSYAKNNRAFLPRIFRPPARHRHRPKHPHPATLDQPFVLFEVLGRSGFLIGNSL
jgi:hypothetical protein